MPRRRCAVVPHGRSSDDGATAPVAAAQRIGKGDLSGHGPGHPDVRRRANVAARRLGAEQLAAGDDPHATTWTPLTFDLDRDLPVVDAEVGPLLNSMNPNLKPFQARGGKLILYHGTADNQLTPYNTINYYDSVVDLLGAKNTNAFARLFLVPGMSHCSGGPGPNTFD